MAWPFDSLTATITGGQSLSDVIHLGGRVLCAIQMPSSWTTAALTFQGSLDGSAWFDLYGADGTEATVMAAASRLIIISTDDFAGVTHLKLRSGTSAAPVTQAADRALTLNTRNVV